MKRGFLILLLPACGLALWWQWTPAIPSLEEGPHQGLCLRLPFTKNGYTIQPLMTYRLTARVVATRRYTESGVTSVSPVDLGLAWGRSADPQRLANASFTQAGRFLNWRSGAGNEIARNEIANTHIIPHTPELESRILAINPGNVVALRGYLVQVDGSWTSSLTRRDIEDGACEIIYVTAIDVLPDAPANDVRSDTASPAPHHPSYTGFTRFPLTLTEKSGNRRIEVVVLAKEGPKIAFARQDDQRLYVVTLDRLSRSNQQQLEQLQDGADVLLRKIEMGLYSRITDIPPGP